MVLDGKGQHPRALGSRTRYKAGHPPEWIPGPGVLWGGLSGRLTTSEKGIYRDMDLPREELDRRLQSFVRHFHQMRPNVKVEFESA